MAKFYHCTTCHKERAGRFTRRKGTGRTHGFSKPGGIPNYYCFVCLPYGEGADEETPMAKKAEKTNPAAAKAVPVPASVKTDELKTSGGALVLSLQTEAGKLPALETEEDYLEADRLVSRIKAARNQWKDRTEPIIRPIRQGLDLLYKLVRDVDKPLETLETQIKSQMRDYKIEEARRIQAAKEAQEAEERRLLEEAEAKRVKAEQAATPQMRGRLTAQAEKLEEAAAETAQTAVEMPVRGSSSIRTVKKVRVKNLPELLRGVLDGYIPEEAITVNITLLTEAFKDDPVGFKAWPGVEVYDDIQIVGR